MNISSTKTYTIWNTMIQRCKQDRYKNRGIKVCDSWQFYQNFLRDMGEQPEGLSLDRKDNTKGYYKENCRWATPVEQAKNRKDSIEIQSKMNYVTWDRTSEKWRVRIASRLHLGVYQTELEAILALTQYCCILKTLSEVNTAKTVSP